LTEYPKAIKFKYPWRKYQLRVLEELQEHLKDGHLHVVAPPGSGKTVLGLEVAIRINKPTLILAPTRAIRNQWIQRFCELFLQSDTVQWEAHVGNCELIFTQTIAGRKLILKARVKSLAAQLDEKVLQVSKWR